MNLEPSPELRQRVWWLIHREKTATLTADEKKELDAYMEVEHLMRLVKARLRNKDQGCDDS